MEILKTDSNTFGKLLPQRTVTPVCAPGWYPSHPRELEPQLQRRVRHLRPGRPQGQPRQVPAHRQHRPPHGQVSACTTQSPSVFSVQSTLYLRKGSVGSETFPPFPQLCIKD